MGQNNPSGEAVTAIAPCRVDLAGGTLDIWPLYLFHAGAVTVNFAVNILTRCRISPVAGGRIELKSLDTGKSENFRNLDELCGAKQFAHPLPAELVRYVAPEGGVTLDTHSSSPADAGLS